MVDAPLLHLDGLSVAAAGNAPKALIDGLSLTVRAGETQVIVDRSGDGRSALAGALLGAPDRLVTGGRILLRGDDITSWPTDVRAKAGLFLAFGDPVRLGGITILSLLHQAVGARRAIELDVAELQRSLIEWMARLDIDRSFLELDVNDGLTTGQAWQSEMLQLAMLQPALAVLDDAGPGTGLGQGEAGDAVARGLRAVRAERPALGTLAITQCQGPLDHLEPDHVHIMVDGRIVASGGPELASRPETEGYESCT